MLATLSEQGIDRDAAMELLAQALVVPVLTAHPTEVRAQEHDRPPQPHRRTAGDARRGRAVTPDGDDVEAAIGRQIALLWQTRVLRRERLYVTDEVETALSYLRDVFLPVLPALYQRWDKAFGARVPAFLRPGSWIGGDRDGNPFVTAESLTTALAQRRTRY